MFTRSVAVAIARPPDEVFAFVSDARNRPSWDDSVDSEELTSSERLAALPPAFTPMGTITAGPLSTTLVYELAGDGDGTSVRFSVTGRPRGLRLKRVLEAGP